ncbi:HET-domain-containing protein [Nemania sp. FL0916]|nr:HET-domain-containing protein [Nemania sp. FL0916]
MESSSDRVYDPLPNATSIRILVLAPGEPDDEDLTFGLMTSDLDFDHSAFPDSSPPSTEVISSVTGQSTDGDDDSQFLLKLDIDFASNPAEPRLHPFQHYEALSYVWGDLSDPQYVFLEGDKPVPVTRSLYSALRSLRLQRGGRKLWVDALCINQSDHEEKKVQLALMKRVYRQAEKVIAYMPMSREDQKNINELVPKIMKAITLHKEHHDSKPKTEPGSASGSGSSQGQYTGPFNSISGLETTKAVINESQPMSVTMANAFVDNKDREEYLEGFGLPREDSPLWDSWRRFFGSPYFRRVWIWQEIVLGNNLHFWFGNGMGLAEPIFIAHFYLSEDSAAMNMSYNAAWCNSDEDNQDTLNDRLIGSGNARTMLLERIMRGYGRGGYERRLIEKLAAVGTFDATDPRDNIYALLGLASDGASFTEHVSYAPWDSKEKVFFRFARLFVERGEGIDVLLQSGLRDENDEWPSWVPRWDNLERPVLPDSGRSPGKTSTRIQVDESGQTLRIYGTILDDINVVNESVLEALQVTESGVDIMRYFATLGSAFGMIFDALDPEDPEEPLEQIFNVLAQPKTRRKRRHEHQTKEESLVTALTNASLEEGTPKSNDEADKAIDREAAILRTGFHEFLNWMWTVVPQLKKIRSEPEPKEETAHLIQMQSPAEFHAFQKAAIKHIHHRRLCVTKGKRVGVAPKRVKIGDKVAVFEGADIHFVLRPVSREVKGDAGTDGDNEEDVTYRLVGPAFFNLPLSEAIASDRDALNLRIV